VRVSRQPVLSQESAVYRALIVSGRRRWREDYRRWERSLAMQLWQMDVMGRVFLASGQEDKIVTGIDAAIRGSRCARTW
jgi:hypothetical protein